MLSGIWKNHSVRTMVVECKLGLATNLIFIAVVASLLT